MVMEITELISTETETTDKQPAPGTEKCYWCGERDVDPKQDDWVLMVVLGYRFCSKECRLEFIYSK
jgi:hypothetical protein